MSPFSNTTYFSMAIVDLQNLAATAIPGWLKTLMNEEFLKPYCSPHLNKQEMQLIKPYCSECLAHGRKTEKNFLCLHCCIAVCPKCKGPHRSHRLLQIRKYLHRVEVKLKDLEDLVGCSSIQTYKINGAQTVFIVRDPQSRPSKAAGSVCTTCKRCLQDPFAYCSLSCKFTYFRRTKGSTSRKRRKSSTPHRSPLC